MKKTLSLLLTSFLLAQLLLVQTAFAGGSILYSIPKDVLYFFRISTYNSHPLGHKVEDHLNSLFYHDAGVTLFDERTFANIFVVAQGPNPEDETKLSTYNIFTISTRRLQDYLASLPEDLLKTNTTGSPTYYAIGNLYFGIPYKQSDSGQITVMTADSREAFLNMIDQTESVMDSVKMEGKDWVLEKGFFEGYFDFDAIRAFDAKNTFAMPNLNSGWFYLEGNHSNASGMLNLAVDAALTKHLEFGTDFLDTLNPENLLLYPKNDNSENTFGKIFNLLDDSPDQAGGGINEMTYNEKTYLEYSNPVSRTYDNKIPFGCSALPVYDINGLFGAPADFTFTDVNEKSPYFDDIGTLLEKGIVEGYQTPGGRYFYPNNEITRAEFTKLALAAQVKQSGSYGDIGPQLYFFDVSPCEWYAPYINKAYAFGFINGHADGTFKPHDPITRAEALQEMYNALYELRAPAMQEKDPPFTDVSADDWHYEAVKAAYNYGLIDTDEKLFPNQNLTRGEAAKLLTLFFSK